MALFVAAFNSWRRVDGAPVTAVAEKLAPRLQSIRDASGAGGGQRVRGGEVGQRRRRSRLGAAGLPISATGVAIVSCRSGAGAVRSDVGPAQRSGNVGIVPAAVR